MGMKKVLKRLGDGGTKLSIGKNPRHFKHHIQENIDLSLCFIIITLVNEKITEYVVLPMSSSSQKIKNHYIVFLKCNMRIAIKF